MAIERGIWSTGLIALLPESTRPVFTLPRRQKQDVSRRDQVTTLTLKTRPVSESVNDCISRIDIICQAGWLESDHVVQYLQESSSEISDKITPTRHPSLSVLDMPDQFPSTRPKISAESPDSETAWNQKRQKRGYELLVEQMLHTRGHETPRPTPIRLWTHEEWHRDWVLQHVGQLFVAYRKDTLTKFWSSLEHEFGERFLLCFEAREQGISLAQTMHKYIQAEGLFARQNIPADEGAMKIFEHLTIDD
ncbi:hypothetical protein C8J56DRAFT_882001 [Mycena floridula]|nr:hypothetical protein C8J56DRAFT_882001 [Mycena floridula]